MSEVTASSLAPPRPARTLGGRVPPATYVLLAIAAVQFGATLAKRLFVVAGPTGTVLMRTAFGAMALFIVWRPGLLGRTRREYGVAALFGTILALMNTAFYNALDRVPLGVAVTVEFVGPLAVAVFGSRRPLDLVWALLAASGIVLLAPWTGATLNPLGVTLALVAGGFWALYILVGAWMGRVFPPGGTGLALAMGFASLIMLPPGIISAGSALLQWPVLLAGVGVGLLSSAIPYSLELAALRRIPPQVFSILLSLEPAVAALFGFLVLGEQLDSRALIALGLVSLASIGATLRPAMKH